MFAPGEKQKDGAGLDEQAMRAVQQYRFEPATRNGQPVAVKIKVEVAFKLYKKY